MKKLLSGFLAFALSLSLLTFPVSASSERQIENPIEHYSEKIGVTEDELINLEENFENALAEAQAQRQITGEQEIIVPVSENLNLTLSTVEQTIPSRNARGNWYSYQKTVCESVGLANRLGWILVRLDSYGIFQLTAGSIRNSVALDAYGSTAANFWSSSYTGSFVGSNYVRNSFNGSVDIGIDPISMQIQSFSINCTITCYYDGSYTTRWN